MLLAFLWSPARKRAQPSNERHPAEKPVGDERFGPDRLTAVGDKFGMKMRFNGMVPYRITSTVKEFEENELIAWAHFGKHRWRYEL